MSAAPIGFVPDWPAPAGVRAWVTERGPGAGRYGTMNFATHVGDAAETVVTNRARLHAALELPSEPAWLTQVHGTCVLDLDTEGIAPADGAVTGRAGVVCAVLTADCLPVLLTDAAGRRVGVAHAGWRGLANGVLPAAVRALRVPPGAVLAWLGPAIGQTAYEVGTDVRDAFLRVAPESEGRFAANSRGRWQADLYGLAHDSLRAVGVTAIHGGNFCTFAEFGRFFSHRREGPCGRMATLIWRD